MLRFMTAYRSSWAVLPHLIDHTSDNSDGWLISVDDEWVVDSSFDISCADEDPNTIVYFDSKSLDSVLNGFYIERYLSESNPVQSKVYSVVTQHPSNPQAYMYKYEGVWMIGSTYGVDDSFAFCNSNVDSPHLIENAEWSFVNDFWTYDLARIYHPTMDIEDKPSYVESIYDIVRYFHSIHYIPEGQGFLNLRNNAPIPILNLGTGGIPLDMSETIFTDAIQLGYRGFDLAREYGNEDILPNILNVERDFEFPVRNDLFIQTKVWPTDLGFIQTLDAIFNSIIALNTTYIDSYLLHWPRYQLYYMSQL